MKEWLNEARGVFDPQTLCGLAVVLGVYAFVPTDIGLIAVSLAVGLVAVLVVLATIAWWIERDRGQEQRKVVADADYQAQRQQECREKY